MSVLLLNSSVIPSEHRLVKEIRVNVIYRRFLRMSLTENRIRPHSARRPAQCAGLLVFSLLPSVQCQFQRLFFQIQFLHQPGVSVLTDILTFTQLFEGITLRLKRGQ